MFADADLCLVTHGHYFAFIGLVSRPPAEFVAAVRDAAPAVEIQTVEPGRRLTL